MTKLILDVLNSLEVVEQEGGDSAYILVENTPETRAKLNAVGVTDEQIMAFGDEETFCILSLACHEGYADGYQDGKLVEWGDIEDEIIVTEGRGDKS
ncbi:hypothetical protein [Paenibacillus macquariensis]|uniref:Uncharacterized protein n=1 Tax=Paenibacillus macquariensis TaxID=948756 RepID=A0ABY1JX77_9BACL|nr:hypothetical protein [Paenibacillus macquariensis]MEC0089362.1 hypothetical protein [Paenibacillus macquariensis]OAB33242.1 hypothetical protein PMSM_14605 [Paenibacillus macquariensis subsp. macquariensis]SIQ93005.1 hypothetical protein SAMN05421578_10597 [Paenibacillus macquariensis]